MQDKNGQLPSLPVPDGNTPQLPAHGLSDTVVIIRIAQLLALCLVLTSVTEIVRQSEVEHVAIVLDECMRRALDIFAVRLAHIVKALGIAKQQYAKSHLEVLVLIAHAQV